MKTRKREVCHKPFHYSTSLARWNDVCWFDRHADEAIDNASLIARHWKFQNRIQRRSDGHLLEGVTQTLCWLVLR